MTLDELAGLCADGVPVDVEIHGLTPMAYVVYRVKGERRTPLRRGTETLTFPSRAAALVALRQTGLVQATFIHNSAYDEMIGLPAATEVSAFRETVSLRKS